MLLAAADPSIFSETQVVVAIVTGGGLALAATITGFFAWLNTRSARKAVVDHVNDEEGTIARFESKLDDILEWQGRHEALHTRESASRP